MLISIKLNILNIVLICLVTFATETFGQITHGQHTWSDINYLADINGDLDKPIIILEGFDILDDYTVSDLKDNWWDSARFTFNEDILETDHDFIYVDFNNNTQDMNLNAELVMDLIREVNDSKTGNQEGILCGESMGGVIARIALKELENDDYDHQIGLYISYDAPHKGANIPIGYQTFLRHVNDLSPNFLNIAWFMLLGSESPVVLEQKLTSEAAKQMIVHYIDGSTTFNSMQAYLSDLGYPEYTRNVAIASGSNNGTNLGFAPGVEMYQNQFTPSCLVNQYTIRINMTAVNTTNQQVSLIDFDIPPCVNAVRKEGKYTSDAQCYDNCPGGTMSNQGKSTNGITDFCFVPTVSSIDLDRDIIDGADGLYYFNTNVRSKDDIINADQTPFDDIYSGELNSGHIKLEDIFNQGIIDDLIVREVMPVDKFIQNTTYQYNRDFYFQTVTIGRDVNPWSEKNWDTGDVIFKSGTTINIEAEEVILDGGTTIEVGCSFNVN
jgi:hypothetical protein